MSYVFSKPNVQAQLQVPVGRHGPLAPGSAKPRHSRILAEVLDVALQKDTPLSTLFENDPSLNLTRALEALPASSKKALRKHLSEGDLNKFASLSEEPSPEIFFHGLMNMAREMEDNDDLRFAYRAYVVLAKQQTRFPDLREAAQRRLDVLSGKGSFSEQLGFMGNQFINETFKDLPMLAGMVVGTSAFRLGRYGVARRFAGLGKGADALAELKWGQRLLANGVGVASEITAFTAMRWGTQMALGQSPASGFGAFFNQLEQGAWLLGSMRLGGYVLGGISRGTAKYALGNIPYLGRAFKNPTVQRGFEIFGSQLGMELGALNGLYRQDPETGLHKGWYWNLTLAQSLALLTQRNLSQGATSLAFGKRFRMNDAMLFGK